MKDFIVDLEDRPHGLAVFAEVMAAAGLNIEGVCSVFADGHRVDHVLVENVEPAIVALADAGFEVFGPRDVLVVELEDRPGTLAEVARRIADAEVEIDLAYFATQTRLVLGVDDLARAREALELVSG
jgi:hypothetical protein